MSERIKYPTAEKIVEYNLLVLTVVPGKKKDRPRLASRAKLDDVLVRCRVAGGDVYDKATVLLCGLIQEHPFESGNRRTAVIATKAFLIENKAFFSPRDDSDQSKVLVGVRERYYTNDEIKEWLQYGKIRRFIR